MDWRDGNSLYSCMPCLFSNVFEMCEIGRRGIRSSVVPNIVSKFPTTIFGVSKQMSNDEKSAVKPVRAISSSMLKLRLMEDDIPRDNYQNVFLFVPGIVALQMLSGMGIMAEA